MGDKNFIRSENIEIKIYPLTSEKMLMEINTKIL